MAERKTKRKGNVVVRRKMVVSILLVLSHPQQHLQKVLSSYSTMRVTFYSKLFYDIIHSSRQTSKKVVDGKLNAEPKLSHFPKQYSFRQLADKVHTERRISVRDNERRKKARK